MSTSITETVEFDQRVYDLDILKKAAYKFSDAVSFDFTLRNDSIICSLRPLHDKDPADLNSIIQQFRNEVLDQDLRKKISLETQNIRNVILAHVFSNTGLQDG